MAIETGPNPLWSKTHWGPRHSPYVCQPFCHERRKHLRAQGAIRASERRNNNALCPPGLGTPAGQSKACELLTRAIRRGDSASDKNFQPYSNHGRPKCFYKLGSPRIKLMILFEYFWKAHNCHRNTQSTSK